MTDASLQDGPFDLEKLKELIELMEKHELTEISLKQGDQKWRLRRGGNNVMQMIPSTSVSAPAVAEASIAEAPVDENLIEITSPTVGTFYSAPTPDDPPFVTVGTDVNLETAVCIVEAMKVFNQIPAEVSGTIVKILVKNGDAVEFGQPLFKVRPA